MTTKTTEAMAISATITGEESIPPLADASGPECYPTCDIEVTYRGATYPTVGWVVAGWCRDTNHRGNPLDRPGRWEWCECDSDSQFSGRPYAEVADDGERVTLHPGANVGQTATIPVHPDDDPEDVAAAVIEAIRECYDGWSPEAADDDEIREALLNQRTSYGSPRNCDEVSWEGADESVSVSATIYHGTHAGRPVWAIKGDPDDEDEIDEPVYLDRADLLRAVQQLLRGRLERAAAAIDDDRDLAARIDQAVTDPEC
jgi:hypothetical protein